MEGEERSHGAQSLQQGAPREGVGRELEEEGAEQEEDDATERLAQAVAVKVFDRELTESEKEAAGTAFHYAMGATSGALYGAIAEALPEATAGLGLPFGAAVWVIADEGIIPAAGLSKSPTGVPALCTRLRPRVASSLRVDDRACAARSTQSTLIVRRKSNELFMATAHGVSQGEA